MFRIHLRDIPTEGRRFIYDRKTGELNADLADVLGDSDYDVDFFMKPLDGAYEIKGRIKTKATVTCSACGWDLPWPLDKAFHEFLVEENTAQDSHGAHGSESLNLDSADEGYATFRGDHFDIGSYLHEMVALAEPTYPDCGDTQCERLNEVKGVLNRVNSQAQAFEKSGASPFSVLEQLKSQLKS
jgi:uncharacterized metal-binding protein YceD (DUF177 family)